MLVFCRLVVHTEMLDELGVARDLVARNIYLDPHSGRTSWSVIGTH